MRIRHKILQGLVAIVLASAAFSAEATPSTGYFIYDEAGHLIGEYDASGNAVQEHIYLGDRPVAVVQGGSVNYVTTDQLNTPRVVTDSSATVEWSWTSDPFGNGQPTGSLTYNLRFPGQYFDAETGHNYNYFRDYDPGTGRYDESDPIGLAAGLNTYAYADDNPFAIEDPTGTDGVILTPAGPLPVPILTPAQAQAAAQAAQAILNAISSAAQQESAAFENMDSELVDTLEGDEKTCPKNGDFCNERFDAEMATCRALGRAEQVGRVPKGSASRCYESAQARHWACLHDKPEPPFAGWPQY